MPPRPSPTISSSAYDASTGKLTVTGANFTTSAGDYSATALTLTGEGGTTYTLTGGSIEANPTSTTFIVDLSAADQLAVDGLLNKSGTSSVGTTTYNLAATSSFDTGDSPDTTSAVTVSNALTPTISSVSFNDATGVLTLSGTGFENQGGTGGLRLGDFTFTGQGGATYTLGTANAAVTSETAATITLTGADLTNVEALFNDNGTSSSDRTTYNLTAPPGWDADAGPGILSEGVTVSGIPFIYNPDNVVAAAGTGAIALDIAAPTDVGDANTPTVTLDSIPTYGTVQYFNGSTFVTATSAAILTPTELSSLRYLPPASGEFGGQTISYTAVDGSASVQGTIAITVVAEDTGPGSLYFSAFGGTGNGGNPDLYTLNANGDPVAMPLNVANGSFAGEDGGFFQFAGNLYFNANGTATSDTEALYEMDPSGTVTAVSAGANSFDGFFDANNGESADFTAFDGSLYFGANVNTGGQVVKLNADGSSQFITLDSGSQSFAGQNGGFVQFNGDLYFSAITTATNGFGPDLIQLDPNGNVTEISTRSQANAAFGSNAGEDGGFYVFDKALYFNATSDTSLGDTLFELTAGSTTPVAVDPTGNVLLHLPTTSVANSGFHQFDGSLYFNEFSVTLGDDTLFKLGSDGTLTPLTYFNGSKNEALEGAGGSGGFVDFAGSTYFVANTAGEGTQLFRLDGSGNITEITDTTGGAFNDNLPGNFVVFAGKLYFAAYDGSGGDNLYVLAPGATTPAIAFGNGLGGTTDAGVDGGFQVVNGRLYFSAFTADGYQLVQLNADGTTKVIDIAPPINNSFDTVGNINALGVFPGNVITGPAGNDILVGGTANETIIGGPDNNMLEGRGGNDILIGGGGSNDFVFSAAGLANLDTVTNYSLTHGDTLDVSALVDANFINGSPVANFVRVIASGSNNLLLQVDPDGSGQIWEDVAILEYANVLAVNQVTVFFGGADHTITHATGLRPVESDFNADAISDVLWINPSNNIVGDWLMNNGTPTWQIVGTGSSPVNIAGYGDFTGNGTSDVLWENPTNGIVGDWLMNNNVPTWHQIFQSSTTMNIAGVGDFNGDGTSDILWLNPTNFLVGEWQMNNNTPTWQLIGQSSNTMNIAGIGDFTANGKDDILWENPSNGILGMWAINGSTPTYSVIGQLSTTMNIIGTGDFAGNGKDDILWENPTDGTVNFGAINNGQVTSWNVIGTESTAYQVAGIADYYGNGTDDILWRNPSTGDTVIWAMNNGQATSHDLGIASLTVNPVKP